MEITKGKISMRQAFVILVIAISSLIIRVMPIYTTEIAQKGAWLSTIIAFIPYIITIFILNAILKKYPDKGLDQIFEIIFGKIIAKTLVCIYILWLFMLVGIYCRFFAERFLSTILPYTATEFFIIIILGLAYLAVKNNIEAFARTAEVLFILFLIVFLTTFILLISEIKIQNLYPITIYDTGNILKAILPIMGIGSYITYGMFLADKITHKGTMKKYGIQSGIILTAISFFTIIATIGVFDYKVVSQFVFPYFVTLKNVEILKVAERVEAIFISSWAINDFCLITALVYILISLIKRVGKIENKKTIITPVILVSYVISFYISKTKFGLEKFSFSIGIWVNIFLTVIIPLLLLIIGKIRKKM